MRLNLMLLLTLLFPVLGWAYIPSTDLIMDRTTDKHGKGAFQITQDLQFVSADGSIRVREQWWIKDEDEYRLEVTALGGENLKLTYLYKGSQKLRSSKANSERLSQPLVEAFFHARSKSLMTRLTHSIGALPETALKAPPVPKKLEEVNLKSNPHARLTRLEGVTAYAFGSPASAEGQQPPGLWIEQDQFLVRKLRLRDGSNVTANDYSAYSRNLHFPRSRSFVWDRSRVAAKIVSVRPIGAAEVKMDPKSLASDEQWPSDSRTSSMLQSFYGRFR